MKCMFDPKIDCTVFASAKDIFELRPKDILEKACPICPKRLKTTKE